MSVHIYLAPAAHGKSAFAVDLVRRSARNLQCMPVVCVPTQLQLRSWRWRLAEAGGVIGARLLTMDRLCAACLSETGQEYTEIPESVQYRLLRAMVDDLELVYYAPLVARPGFVQVLQGLVHELKASGIAPAAFSAAVAATGDEPRLNELTRIYAAYQGRLQSEAWVDRAGMTWLAAEVLASCQDRDACAWPLVVVDGFDDLTNTQIALLRVLSGRVKDLVITLTGTPDGPKRPLVHRRFEFTIQRIASALAVKPEPLPGQEAHRAPALEHLEASLYTSDPSAVDAAGAVEMVEAADRAGEVRAALRWLKAGLVESHMRPRDLALVMRNVAPYRPFILQTASEFGLPIRLLGGLPLASNPAIAALLDLMRLAAPASGDDPRPSLPWRLVVEAWRSPYFDWSALTPEGSSQSIGIRLQDADALDATARWGRVIGGLAQWEEALALLAGRSHSREDEEGRRLPDSLPVQHAATQLLATFRRFVERIAPPRGPHTYREFVAWVEDLMGPDPAPGEVRFPSRDDLNSLQVVSRARHAMDTGPLAEVAELDVAALQALKDVLRGLVWAEEALGVARPVEFSRFFTDLEGAVETSTYHSPVDPGRDEILVADVIQARGVSFRSVAVVGLAEGEFPGSVAEDPLMRNADRERMHQECGLPLRPSTESAEAEYFYETVSHPRERLLLTRPRLAENGAEWQASPFWEQVLQHVRVRPRRVGGESAPPPETAASWPELLESLAVHGGSEPAWEWVRQENALRFNALQSALDVIRQRGSNADASRFDGDLGCLAEDLTAFYGPPHPWSASRLESYRSCPFQFFVRHVLDLEPRGEPGEGLDVSQLGDIFHRVLEHVYQAEGVHDPSNLQQLLTALPEAARQVLDAAPEVEGFRVTAWWQRTREEIVDKVRRSLEALHSPAIQADFVPYAHEQRFRKASALKVVDGTDHFFLHGMIDRVDRTPDGRLRIIDYKSGGPWDYDNAAVAEGKKLQLPLYALAARDALQLGRIEDGFYWHVQHVRASPFSLRGFAKCEGRDALEVAVERAWEAVRGVRGGRFRPKAPDDGCPDYCPAAVFCWRYRPRFKR